MHRTRADTPSFDVCFICYSIALMWTPFETLQKSRELFLITQSPQLERRAAPPKESSTNMLDVKLIMHGNRGWVLSAGLHFSTPFLECDGRMASRTGLLWHQSESPSPPPSPPSPLSLSHPPLLHLPNPFHSFLFSYLLLSSLNTPPIPYLFLPVQTHIHTQA